MTLNAVSLDDKYDLSKRQVLLSGAQALVRLMLMQQARDKRAGLDTAGYVTGYRGSPLGGVDQQFERAGPVVKAGNIVFQPGLNEELAATALFGAQQAEMRGEGRYDGVFGMWYGKGPGVDRSGDAFRHANMAGTSRHGGVLVLAGDDHGAESSTVAHHSEFALIDAMIPVLHPAGVQEILDFGILGLALSRFSGLWVGVKCVHDNVESTAVVDGSLDRIAIKRPDGYRMPPGGLNIRPGDDRVEQERRLHTHKREAAIAFARENALNRIVMDGGAAPKIGVIATGKSYLDTCAALDCLGIDEAAAARLGLRLLKVGMVWPLDGGIVADFARGLDLVIVVEEKRALIETQMRDELYGKPNAPAIIGKSDENGRPLFPSYGTLEPHQIAVALGERLLARGGDDAVMAGLAAVRRAAAGLDGLPDIATRIAYFCAGCPYNVATIIPEGARGYAGIGCHWMVQAIPGRRVEGATQMGGEGANWIGEAPFSSRRHIFQQVGDGTYGHSGSLAIRAAVASGVTMTFKILFNDAVAMTGGQGLDGGLTVPAIAHQVEAEGVRRIAVVSDEPEKYRSRAGLPKSAMVHHRRDLDAVQKALMDEDGVSVLIYDQTCAAEKRRRRKRGAYPDPARRVFINAEVCEGCGDCGLQSNCVAIQPLETPFGRKRRIEQSICNKDFSCLDGFCPSFVTVEGGALAAPAPVREDEAFAALPEPKPAALDAPYAILITGVGGTGVVTVGAILAMAAHLEGKGAGLIDMTGISQKNGGVATHLKIAARPPDINAIRVPDGAADLVIGCDLVTSASAKILMAAGPRTRAIVNTHELMPAVFTQQADYELPTAELKAAIAGRVGKGRADFIDATHMSAALTGDSITTNLFMLGYAVQKGLLPVAPTAIDEAIALNGVAVEMNRSAFSWGRRAAHDLARVKRRVGPPQRAEPESLDALIARRVEFLTAYQDAAYADKYCRRVEAARAAEAKVMPGSDRFAEAVARSLFKLMAYKDEYEVARLYTDGAFARSLAATFTGGYRLKFHLAPPLFARPDPATGRPRKRAFGPWMFALFRLLAKGKALRGTPFDMFAWSAERRLERRLLGDYEAMLDEIIASLSSETHAGAIALAALPEKISGFGPVKQAAAAGYEAERARLLAAFRGAGAADEPSAASSLRATAAG
ncbi:MAG: indolepyruvate ferredoxin oxidoreductase family protein [Hyphomicrobiales bacterium]|nr:indolepyruvate ferredoxin oxidoreductase family protein [Hyphomicrobiales bacterium]